MVFANILIPLDTLACIESEAVDLGSAKKSPLGYTELESNIVTVITLDCFVVTILAVKYKTGAASAAEIRVTLAFQTEAVAALVLVANPCSSFPAGMLIGVTSAALISPLALA